MLYKASSILHDYMLAEDAVSEAFIRIYKNIDKIEDPVSKKSIAFVMTIVRNTSLTILEKNKKSDFIEEEDTRADSFDLENHILS